jgi:hypothetical protein
MGIIMTEQEELAYEAVARAARDLIESGYDGPFCGEAVEPLLNAVAALEGPAKAIECLTLRREVAGQPGLYQWLVANGMNMGRWTLHFGVHCYADSHDCKTFLQRVHEEQGGEIITTHLQLPAGAYFHL